jgi:replicative DNA helicase
MSKDNYLNIERQIIHLMLHNLPSIDEMLEGGFGPEFFDPIHQYLVRAIFDEYDSSGHKRLLTRDAYRQKLKDDNILGDSIARLSIHDKCSVGVYTDSNDLGMLKKQLVEAFMARNGQKYIQQFADESKDKGFLAASQNLMDRMQTSLGITETRRVVYSSVKDLKSEYIKEINEMKENPSALIRCGIPEIDDVVNIGFKPQHLTLFVADVGGHKSNMMINIAINLAKLKHDVLFVPLEMNRFDLMNRIICNETGIDNSLLFHPEKMSAEDMHLIDSHEMWNGYMQYFHILDADERTTVSALKREIENKAMIVKPKVVIIDYVDNLQSDILYGQKHIEIGEILKSLRFLGKKHKFHTISAAQMGRAAIKALREGKSDAVDSTSIHGSHQYSADSDTIFALMKVPNEINRIKVYTIKARHGPSGQTQELKVDPTKFRIYSTKYAVDSLVDTGIDIVSSMDISESEIKSGTSEEISFNNILDLDDELS